MKKAVLASDAERNEMVNTFAQMEGDSQRCIAFHNDTQQQYTYLIIALQ
jgi:hypothetical protein